MNSAVILRESLKEATIVFPARRRGLEVNWKTPSWLVNTTIKNKKRVFMFI